jgi:hypothetical protein
MEFCGSDLENFVRRWGGVRELIVVCGSEGRCGRKRAGKHGRVVRVKWRGGESRFFEPIRTAVWHEGDRSSPSQKLVLAGLDICFS